MTAPNYLKVIKLKCEKDFYFFCRYMFQRQSGSKFVKNWHHETITDALTEVAEYKTRNLIINMPPRYGKTELAVKMFIAWSIAKDPRAKFIHLSYSSELALDNSAAIKDLIESDYFQEIWPVKLRKDSKSKKLWKTEEGGGLYATSTGGQITGFGAGNIRDGTDQNEATSTNWLDDYSWLNAYDETEEEQEFQAGIYGGSFGGAIIIDDPHKVDDIGSDVERIKVNNRLNETITSRRNSRNTPIIVIMQRLHIMDMTGYLLAGGIGEDFKCVTIPAIIEEKDAEGEVVREKALWGFKHTLDDLKRLQKAEQRIFAGQFMQTPVPKGGADFKTEWVKYYDATDLPWSRFIPYILVDAANSRKRTSDYTAMMVVLTGGDKNYYLADMVRDRLNPTERIETLIDLHKKWLDRTGKSPRVGYEQYGMMSDTHYLTEAQRAMGYNMNVVELGGRQSKEDRIRRLVPLFQNGNIYIPKVLIYVDAENERRDLVNEFVNDEYVNFPVAAHDDMLDALARILDHDMRVTFPKISTSETRYQRTQPPKSANRAHFVNM